MGTTLVTPCGKRVLFSHIPKTGGQWVENVLNHLAGRKERIYPPAYPGIEARHAAPSQVRGKFDYVFTVIRHPLTWLESWYRYQMAAAKRRSTRHWRKYGITNIHPIEWANAIEPTKSHVFSEYIDNYLRLTPGGYSTMCDKFIGPPNSRDTSVIILKQESLRTDLLALLNRVGYNLASNFVDSFPADNKSQWPRQHYTDNTRQQVCHVDSSLIKEYYSDENCC